MKKTISWLGIIVLALLLFALGAEDQRKVRDCGGSDYCKITIFGR
jgi:hypothetical protein